MFSDRNGHSMIHHQHVALDKAVYRIPARVIFHALKIFYLALFVSPQNDVLTSEGRLQVQLTSPEFSFTLYGIRSCLVLNNAP